MIKNIVVLLLISLSYTNATYIYGSINGSHVYDDYVLDNDSSKSHVEATIVNAYIIQYLNIIHREFIQYKNSVCEKGLNVSFNYNMSGIYNDTSIDGNASMQLSTSRCNEDIKNIKWFIDHKENELEADLSYDSGFLYIVMNINVK